mmetsp:Transcript_2339/g.6255  ORF Transcript_2339/g.6255 Transcript_2339/m.6255 type:complete len:427 (+) Transcript_2339:250-1530(+)
MESPTFRSRGLSANLRTHRKARDWCLLRCLLRYLHEVHWRALLGSLSLFFPRRNQAAHRALQEQRRVIEPPPGLKPIHKRLIRAQHPPETQARRTQLLIQPAVHHHPRLRRLPLQLKVHLLHHTIPVHHPHLLRRGQRRHRRQRVLHRPHVIHEQQVGVLARVRRPRLALPGERHRLKPRRNHRVQRRDVLGRVHRGAHHLDLVGGPESSPDRRQHVEERGDAAVADHDRQRDVALHRPVALKEAHNLLLGRRVQLRRRGLEQARDEVCQKFSRGPGDRRGAALETIGLQSVHLLRARAQKGRDALQRRVEGRAREVLGPQLGGRRDIPLAGRGGNRGLRAGRILHVNVEGHHVVEKVVVVLLREPSDGAVRRVCGVLELAMEPRLRMHHESDLKFWVHVGLLQPDHVNRIVGLIVGREPAQDPTR